MIHMGNTSRDVRLYQEAEAVRLRTEGVPVDAIAAHLAVSPRTVHTRIRDGLRRQITDDMAADLRRLTESRLDRWARRLARLVEDADTPEQEVAAIRAALAVERERMRLLGYAVPQVVVARHEFPEAMSNGRAIGGGY